MRGRFTTSNNKKPGLGKFLNLPVSLFQAINRKLFNIYPELPWIPFNAIKQLNRVINPDWQMLEIGSGMSTIWLSKKGKSVISIESNKTWVELLGAKIKAQGIQNIDLLYIWQREEMADFSKYPDGHFDFIYIDGGPRELCCTNALEKLKKGGYIYLDNTDSDHLVGNGPAILKPHFEKHEYFVDFVPGNVMVNEGMLFHKKL